MSSAPQTISFFLSRSSIFHFPPFNHIYNSFFLSPSSFLIPSLSSPPPPPLSALHPTLHPSIRLYMKIHTGVSSLSSFHQTTICIPGMPRATAILCHGAGLFSRLLRVGMKKNGCNVGRNWGEEEKKREKESNGSMCETSDSTPPGSVRVLQVRAVYRIKCFYKMFHGLLNHLQFALTSDLYPYIDVIPSPGV